MGLHLDMPKQGSGNTNDGNSARRFFENPELTSTILHIDSLPVERFSVLQCVINSEFFTDVKKLEQYCTETCNIYVNNCGWYIMPSTVHKILVHAPSIVDHCQQKGIPVSAYSEEEQETRNKDLREFREHRARKAKRILTNTDVFRRLLIILDPCISSMRSRRVKRKRALRAEVLALLSDKENIT
ncbi:hypothetical protein FOCC_FOCC002075 [Frankliniella occidentalis]|nr:hypothetical protein FOCC_FOCC002075 [Frankliniella occidentalis]